MKLCGPGAGSSRGSGKKNRRTPSGQGEQALGIELESERAFDDEVIQFVTDWRGYYAYTVGGLRLNIIHSTSVQPEIENPDDYYTWLWIESLQGFFLMRQRLCESVPQPWFVVREYVPRDPYNFFFMFLEALRPALGSDGEVGPLREIEAGGAGENATRD